MPRRGENIRKRKDGRWEGRYIAERKSDGRAVYRSVYAASYTEVRKKLAEAKQSADNSDTNTFKGRSKTEALLETVCMEWLAYVNRSIRSSTYAKYYNICKNHVIPCLGKVPCNKLSDNQINKFIDGLRTPETEVGSATLSDSSIRTICTILNAVFRYALSNGYMSDIPNASIKNERSSHIRIFSQDEQKRLIRYILGDPDNGKIGILICLYTGLRIGEICALTWDDIDTSAGTLRVNKTIQRIQNVRQSNYPKFHDKKDFSNHGKKHLYINERKTYLQIDAPKSAHSSRVIPLPQFLCEIIQQVLIPVPGAYFLSDDFEKPVEPRTYQYRYRKYLKEAGIEVSNFHVLRHTFATQCVNLGFDAKTLSEILGHSNVSITLGKYVHPTLEMKREQMNRLIL